MPLLTRSASAALDVEQARDRTSSYIYGNIIVLAATVEVTPHAVATGAALLVVAGTAVTTFLAHVLAHAVGHRIGHEDDADHHESVRHVLRNAVPIVTSGLVPLVLLAIAWPGWLDATVAQSVASLVLIVRIALVGLIVQRLSGRPASHGAFWSGIGIAVVAALIVAVKVVVAH